MKPRLNIESLCIEAYKFSVQESLHQEASLYGKSSSKSIGTYLEHKFKAELSTHYEYVEGNSAYGVDLLELGVDIKVTSLKQPQSSCPYRDAAQKIYGLGYHLLIFVYEKYDDHDEKTVRLDMKHTIFVNRERTADYQTTRGLLDILRRDGNEDDISAFLLERNLPVDEIGANQLAARIIQTPPIEGYLTVSNALQWRLQYKRVIQQAGLISGIRRVR